MAKHSASGKRQAQSETPSKRCCIHHNNCAVGRGSPCCTSVPVTCTSIFRPAASIMPLPRHRCLSNIRKSKLGVQDGQYRSWPQPLFATPNNVFRLRNMIAKGFMCVACVWDVRCEALGNAKPERPQPARSIRMLPSALRRCRLI